MTDSVLPKSLWKFYFNYAARDHWLMLVIWMVVVLLVSFDRVLQPLIQGWMVGIFEAPVPDGVNFIRFALPTIILITVINLGITGMATVRGWVAMHWKPQTRRSISEALTAYVHGQSMSFWTSRMPGQVNSQMNYIADGFGSLQEIWAGICRALTILLNGALLFDVNRYVAFMFVGVLAFRIIFAWKMRNPLKRASKHVSSVASTLSGKIVDSISNYSLVKLFARARREEKYLAPTRSERVDASMRVGFFERIFWAIPGALWDILFGVTLLLCAWLYMRGDMTIADVVFTTGVYFSVMGTISGLIDSIPGVIDKLGAASKAYDELIVPIDVVDAENAQELLVRHGRIEFKNVSFKYKKKWVLRNLNLTINAGERVGLVGASGAGKTTLVNLLMRFYEPSSGQILIDGWDIRDVTQDSLRESIAFIPQDPTMFNRTIGENIAYGRPDADMREIRSAARRAAADTFIMSTEKKYDSMVGDRGIKMSGGQRQRIAIARAFLKDAPILILDEATSALDSETEVAIQKSFEELAAGRTTIAIAHRLSTLRNMDRIIVLSHGRILEQGSHTALLRKKGEYARLWKMQSGGFIQE